MQESVDTCITGWGVSCGAEVHLRSDCSVEISKGLIVRHDGTLLHTPTKLFRYYVKPQFVEDRVKNFMLSFLNIKQVDEQHLQFLVLADEHANDGKTDSLKQQHPQDIPEQNLMWNKVASVLSFPMEDKANADNAGETKLYWILVSRNAIAKSRNWDGNAGTDSQELFTRVLARQEIDVASIDEHLRPVLKLPCLTVPRFGYKTLAIKSVPEGLRDENLHNPFSDVNTFGEVFFEYKAIIDDYILQVYDALTSLHDHFGPVLSHKGANYLETCRKTLLLKRKKFYDEGDHLYYIQYFYDWLRDLTIAYNELVALLIHFRGGCACFEKGRDYAGNGMIVLLGPVLGGRTTYQPLVFRDLATPAEKDQDIRELRCIHWRLMMMIRTFDLPFLHLEKAIAGTRDDQGIEEKLDSTNYWEYINSLQDNNANDEYNWLPIKFTPTRASCATLGHMAIPYYYPLDSNSIYSVHQFWHYQTTVLRRADTLLSYNAHQGDDTRPSTDTVNDSYTSKIETILPLAFNLEPFTALRPEGYIGKRLTLNEPDKLFFFKSFPLHEYLVKYNLCIDVIAIGLKGGDNRLELDRLCGLEHRPAMQQGHTLVLLFVDTDTERIQLQECQKGQRPVDRNTVVADFILPYRYSCCPAGGVTAYTLIPISVS